MPCRRWSARASWPWFAQSNPQATYETWAARYPSISCWANPYRAIPLAVPPRTCASKTLPTTSQGNQVASKLKRFGMQQAETDILYWVFEQVPQSA